MNIVLARVSISILPSTMDSFKKDTYRYALAMVKAARSMPADMAEKLKHIKELRTRINRIIT